MTPKRSGGDGGFVYSTQFGRLCAECNQPIAGCTCRKPGGPPRDGVVRVGRETQGRKGKGVTVVSGLPFSGDELARLAKELKKKCGAGGTVRGDVVEVQGDHRDLLVDELRARGYQVKRVG